ncbi:MAG: UPF0280 family protein [SAR324 cluster bacterium]|nr:UPF0280 family protein [SAR324 cluster bacterium]
MMKPLVALLPDGRRLHLHHGPIDLVAECFGAVAEISASYEQARQRFQTVLEELVAELPLLRTPIDGFHAGTESSSIVRPEPVEGRKTGLRQAQPERRRRTSHKLVEEPQGAIARRMVAVVRKHEGLVTPMAAVAGAVAEEILEAMVAGRSLWRAYVNNGGDIAFMLDAGERFQVGVVNNEALPGLNAQVELRYNHPVRGLATSGWRGRSHSLGIADAVTVLARTAAEADVAATLIANAVNAEHPGIVRQPACALEDDSDLGDRLVTVAVPELPQNVVASALECGVVLAQALLDSGHIEAAYLALQGETRTLSNLQTQQIHDRPDPNPQNHHHA